VDDIESLPDRPASRRDALVCDAEFLQRGYQERITVSRAKSEKPLSVPGFSISFIDPS